MNLISQADFARLHDVSRKTVTTWKKRGYIELSGGLVDVERSNAKLVNSGRVWLQSVTSAADEVTGNSGMTPEALLWETAGPHRDRVAGMACMISPAEFAALLLRHLPPATVRPLVTEWIATGRRGGSEILHEDGIAPPAEFASWADHPWFNPMITEDEWSELEAEAQAHMAGADA